MGRQLERMQHSAITPRSGLQWCEEAARGFPSHFCREDKAEQSACKHSDNLFACPSCVRHLSRVGKLWSGFCLFVYCFSRCGKLQFLFRDFVLVRLFLLSVFELTEKSKVSRFSLTNTTKHSGKQMNGVLLADFKYIHGEQGELSSRAPGLWSKGRGFDSPATGAAAAAFSSPGSTFCADSCFRIRRSTPVLPQQHSLLQGQLSVLTLVSVSGVPPLCYRSST